jgi:hypothetical protein
MEKTKALFMALSGQDRASVENRLSSCPAIPMGGIDYVRLDAPGPFVNHYGIGYDIVVLSHHINASASLLKSQVEVLTLRHPRASIILRGHHDLRDKLPEELASKVGYATMLNDNAIVGILKDAFAVAERKKIKAMADA